jgi:AcrR family transcriptional regulator
VRLHEVAAAAGTTLDEVRHHFREKDELVDAWFDRADASMLQDAAFPECLQLPIRERLHRVMMVWLDTLYPHRGVTRQMILAKCEPGHLHIQIPAVMRISRTVQWMREAGGLHDAYLYRALAETALTGIYLMTFVYWMGDESPGSTRTREFLDSLLRRAERLALSVPGFATPAEVAPREPGSPLAPTVEGEVTR